MEHAPEYILQPSTIPDAGVGCFALSALAENMRLNVNNAQQSTRLLSEQAIPDVYLKYCVLLDSNAYLAPACFTAMSVFWYINHAKEPNVGFIDHKLHALHPIKPGEELTLYYPDLLTHPKNKLWVRPEHI